MKYIDSITDPDTPQPLSEENKEVAVCETKTLVAACHKLMDEVLSWREENLEQIALYSDSQKFPTPFPALSEYIKFMEQQNRFFEIDIQLMLYYGDIMVAYKNMGMTSDDWEIRVHIRRIYTLLYEICFGFCRNAGTPVGYLKRHIVEEDKDILDRYDTCLKNLKNFLESHQSEFYKIRNKTEAHKDPDVCVQISLIENISISSSSSIIETAIKKLNQVLHSMTPLFNLFNQRLHTLKDAAYST